MLRQRIRSLLPPRDADDFAKAIAAELAQLGVRATATPLPEEPIVTGSLCIDLRGCDVFVSGVAVSLKPREFALLKVLALNLGGVLSRDQIISLAWSNADKVNSNRTVDVHIRRLRIKLGNEARLVRTVGGIGYKLVRAVPTHTE